MLVSLMISAITGFAIIFLTTGSLPNAIISAIISVTIALFILANYPSAIENKKEKKKKK